MRSVRLYWWRPTTPLRSLATELRWHAAAWATMLGHGGRMTNFGDELSPLAVAEVSGRPVVWSPIRSAEVVAVGSVLNGALALPRVPLVFGSGLRGAEGTTPTAEPERFVLVRGTLTRDALGLPSTAPLGDPGVIARELFPVPVTSRGSHGPLFIPHFAMLRTRHGRDVVSQFRRAGWDVVLPNRTPATVARSVATASIVVTTSLHALVFAHSFGTPAALLEWQAALVEPAFKYEDYMTASGVRLEKVSLRDALVLAPHALTDRIAETSHEIARTIDGVIATVYAAGEALR